MSDPIFGLEKDHRIPEGENVSLLTTVHDVVLLGMVRGLLEDADIPYLVKERATGSAMRILTGFSMYGTDIFVPTSALETAQELISGFDGQAADADSADDPEDPNGDGDEEAES